jgi:hypothetical protein
MLASRPVSDDPSFKSGESTGTFLDTKMVHEAGIAPRGTADEGARAVLSAIEHALSGVRGAYLDRTQPAHAEPDAYDVRAQQRLRARTLELLQLA